MLSEFSLPIATDKQIHVARIEMITSLCFLYPAYENDDFIQGMTDVEILISYLSKKYGYDYDLDTFSYIRNIVRFSELALTRINANFKEFYYGLSYEDALEIVLVKLTESDDTIQRDNDGFPQNFNLNGRSVNINYKLDNNMWWFPYSQCNNINQHKLLSVVLGGSNIDLTKYKILYHGTSWVGAQSIMEGIEIRPRNKSTDFGMMNFYLGDNFTSAYVWALRKQQPAIVIFIVPNEFIEGLERKLLLNHTSTLNEWKKLVFTCRNRPTGYGSLQNRKNHDKFVKDLDSNDLVSGPMMSNVNTKTIEDVKFIEYGHGIIPYQYSFKESSCELLQQYIFSTIFFKS